MQRRMSIKTRNLRQNLKRWFPISFKRNTSINLRRLNQEVVVFISSCVRILYAESSQSRAWRKERGGCRLRTDSGARQAAGWIGPDRSGRARGTCLCRRCSNKITKTPLCWDVKFLKYPKIIPVVTTRAREPRKPSSHSIIRHPDRYPLPYWRGALGPKT